jgi:hypothetical protein
MLAALAVPTGQTASAAQTRPELGINVVVDMSISTPTTALAQLKKVFAYCVSLHANAVALNFPFYVSSTTANDPHSGVGTPSVSLLGQMIALAQHVHLRVQLRPGLDERNLRPSWRGAIAPSDPAAWFSAYWTWMEPYLALAQSTRASSFDIGMELDSLVSNDGALWPQLVSEAAGVYSGTLLYAGGNGIYISTPGTHLAYDAYQPIYEPNNKAATVAALTAGFQRNFNDLNVPGGLGSLRLGEVGLSATTGAYDEPYQFNFPANLPVVRSVQTNWFKAACNFFWSNHVAGIYFWALFMNSFSPTENDSAIPTEWVGTPSATAIRSCFARTT